ncbi:MAG: metal-sensitive transcriptional regulator [Burkholderiales bacterium]|nr:metal-sensitive transcriptional regulator [Burkholderiales bacterium]
MAKETADVTNLSQPKQRRDMIVRLKRIEGQLRGIQKMIEDGAECEDVAQQLSASRKALDKAFYHMLACVVEHPESFGVSAGAHGAAKARGESQHLKQVAALIARFG